MNFMAQMYGVDLHRGSGLTSCSFACSGAAKARRRLPPGVPVPRPRQMRLREEEAEELDDDQMVGAGM